MVDIKHTKPGKLVVDWWPDGYEEKFDDGLRLEPLVKAIKTLPKGRLLEIGCGNGYWTNRLLVPKFEEVICIDRIERPEGLKAKYIKTDGYTLPFEDKSFDVVYSFGVFCHFYLEDQISYLKEIKRVLTGKALISFANWKRHPELRERNGYANGWHYNDLEITKDMCKDFNFIDFDPSYRDTLAILW